MNILIGEFQKQRRNYYSSASNCISLLLWPILKFFQTLFIYKSFDIEPLKEYSIFTNDDLIIFILIGIDNLHKREKINTEKVTK